MFSRLSLSYSSSIGHAVFWHRISAWTAVVAGTHQRASVSDSSRLPGVAARGTHRGGPSLNWSLARRWRTDCPDRGASPVGQVFRGISCADAGPQPADSDGGAWWACSSEQSLSCGESSIAGSWQRSDSDAEGGEPVGRLLSMGLEGHPDGETSRAAPLQHRIARTEI